MGDDDYTLADAAQAATRMLRHKVSDAEIKDLLPEHYREDAFELARLRNQASERFEDPWELWFTEEGLRYATPDVVARARANRLADHGDEALDPACGVGVQLAFLARRVGPATGIELDEATAEMARRNLAALDADAEVLVGDCLDEAVRSSLADPDVVVCDPARDPEADERTLAGLSPDPREVHAAYARSARAWCYELPPMIDPERVRAAFEGELEYTSLHGDLNRLAVFGGDAARARVSALALPARERLADADPARELERVDDPDEFVHLVDRTVLQAGLLDRLAERLGTGRLLAEEHPRRTLLAGSEPSDTAFAEDFRVLDRHVWNLMGLREKLKRLDAGHVTLRAGVDPDRYWDVRNALEQGLEGERHVHLFRVAGEGLIVEPLAADDGQQA